MTDKELFEDLKQFISVTVSQQLADVATKDDIESLTAEFKADINGLRGEVKGEFELLDDRLDAIQEAISEALERNEAKTQTKLDDHEHRLHRLEKRSA